LRWKPVRITEVWVKAAYIAIGWFLLPLAASRLLTPIGAPEPVALGLELAWTFAVVLLGCRIFRVRGEEVEPPRRWWRATGRPAAGFVLSAFMIVAALTFVVPPFTMPDYLRWWYAATSLPIAGFYLHSSIRLARGDAPVPARPSRDDTARILKRGVRL